MEGLDSFYSIWRGFLDACNGSGAVSRVVAFMILLVVVISGSGMA